VQDWLQHGFVVKMTGGRGDARRPSPTRPLTTFYGTVVTIVQSKSPIGPIRSFDQIIDEPRASYRRLLY
jgi:hypothetical protein